ncbi:MAG: ATP-binding protein [Bacteroidota bacterium]
MTYNELRRIAAAGEGLHTEFKRKLPEWEKLIREVVAFANTEGGVVLIGVDDDGSLPGTRDPREIEEVLELKLPTYARPAPEFTLEAIPLTRKRAVVAIHVPESRQKPHYALSAPDAETGTVLIRIADSSAAAGREMRALLKFESRPTDIKVEFGEKERRLMQYLDDHLFITVSDFKAAAGINSATASRTLVHLCKANVLRILPQVEAPDRFVPVEQDFSSK